MNSDYVTALRIEQHRADLVREAHRARLVRSARLRLRAGRLSPAPATLPWRRRPAPGGCPEVAGA